MFTNGNKYYDTDAAMQVIGCSMIDPSLMNDDGKHFFREEDFAYEFHRVVFGAIYNLHINGSKDISLSAIEGYLRNRDSARAVFHAGNGPVWVENVKKNADLSNFEVNYGRLKKMTLLRQYNNIGLDVKFLYDPDNIVDVKKKQNQIDYLDSKNLNELADLIDNKVLDVRAKYIDNSTDEAERLGDSVSEVLDNLFKEPEVGLPMYGKFVNTITKGCRLGKFFVRSAASGVGKTRTMIADVCSLSCSYYFVDGEEKQLGGGERIPVLYISTELDKSEVITMCLAFLSGVDEDKIIMNNYSDNEEKRRVNQAAEELKQAPLYIEEMPNFTIKQVENAIKRSIRIHRTQYIFFDYLHSSMGILQEISQATKGTHLREDNILFMFAVALKDIANKYNVFVLTSTQLNGSWKTDAIPDQNLLRGAKAIADRCDIGMILLDVTPEDCENVDAIVKKNGCTMPNVKMSVYKNRRGSYNKMYLWMRADKSTCRFDGLFATDYNYKPIYIDELEINLKIG